MVSGLIMVWSWLGRLWGGLRRLWFLWLTIAGLLVVGTVLWAAVVEPSWLLPDTRGLSPADRVRAQTDLRDTLVTMLGGLAVLAGAAVGAVNLAATQRVQWRGQVTDRFSRAMEHLGQQGPQQIDLRIGAVYALEQIARDSAELHWPIMEVLTAYLREHARIRPDAASPRLPGDHQAIATVIGARRREWDADGHPRGRKQRLNLSGTDLSRVRWIDAHLEGMNLSESLLEGANLTGAYLRDANLGRAHLEGADLNWADLRGACLEGAHLHGADLREVEGMTREQLHAAADWSGARLPAHLQEAPREAAPNVPGGAGRSQQR